MKEFQIVPLSLIQESETNPRRRFSEKGMEELTDSVRKHGVLVPLLVRPIENGTPEDKRPKFEIVAGARRYRAAKAAGLEDLPIRIKELEDGEMLELQVIENLMREDVHPLEEALGYQSLLTRPGYDVAAIAAKTAKSESYIYQRLKLAELIRPAQDAFLEDRITAGHAILIARLQPKDQERALSASFESYERDGDGMAPAVPVRELNRWIQHTIHLDLNTAPFSKTEDRIWLGPAKDLTSWGVAVPCITCPKRTGFAPQLFPDVAKKDTCTDPECYELKLNCHAGLKKYELESGGTKVVEVTRDYSYNLRSKEEKKLLPGDKYSIIEKKKDRCEHAEKAIVVHGHVDRGQVIDICRDPGCKTHGRRSIYATPPAELARQKAADAKRKREMEIRRQTLADVLRRVPLLPLDLSREDWNLIAYGFLNEMTQDKQKLICQSHEWQATKHQYGNPDWSTAISKQIPLLPIQDLMRLLIEFSVAGELLIGTWEIIGKPKHLSEISERYGVNVAAIENSVDAGIAEKKTKKAVKSGAKPTKSGQTQTKQSKPDSKRSVNKAKRPKGGKMCERCQATTKDLRSTGSIWSQHFYNLKRNVCTSCEEEIMIAEEPQLEKTL